MSSAESRYQVQHKMILKKKTPIELLDKLAENTNYIMEKVIHYMDHTKVPKPACFVGKNNIFNVERKYTSLYENHRHWFSTFGSIVNPKGETFMTTVVEIPKDNEKIGCEYVYEHKKRLFKSLKKLCYQVNGYKEYIFDEENFKGMSNLETMESYLESGLSRTRKDEESHDIGNLTEIECIDGFIMNGKSAELKRMQLFDNEMDVFYRSKLLRQEELLPQKYYFIFEIIGLYLSFFRGHNLCHLDGLRAYYLDRSYFSWTTFEHLRNTPNSTEVDYLIRMQKFFETFLIMLSIRPCHNFSNPHYEFPPVTIRYNFTSWPNGKVPWPLKEERNIERLAYENEEKLKQEARKFDEIYNDLILSAKTDISF